MPHESTAIPSATRVGQRLAKAFIHGSRAVGVGGESTVSSSMAGPFGRRWDQPPSACGRPAGTECHDLGMPFYRCWVGVVICEGGLSGSTIEKSSFERPLRSLAPPAVSPSTTYR